MNLEQQRDAMMTAYRLCVLCHSPTTQNGSVLVGNNMAKWYGWNQIWEGHGTWDRPADVRHAEIDCIIGAPFVPNGGSIVAVWAACAHCAACIAHASVRRLYRCAAAMRREHPDWDESIRRGEAILRDADVEIIDVEPDESYRSLEPIRFRGRLWHPLDGFLDEEKTVCP